MARSRILFLSDKNRYLEHELYCLVAKNIPKSYDVIYFESDYLTEGLKQFRPNEVEEKKVAFSHIELLRPIQLVNTTNNSFFKKVLEVSNRIVRILKWKKAFLNTIDYLKPDGVVFITPFSFNAKLIMKYRPSITTFYLQSCNERKVIQDKVSLKKKLRKCLYDNVLGLPIYNVSKNVFGVSGVKNYIIWSPIWMGDSKKRMDATYISCGAPLYDRFFNLYAGNRIVPSKPNVLVVLNKERNTGIVNWNLYASFYRDLIEAYPSFNFIFKAHPLGSLNLVKTAFPNSIITQEPYPLSKVDLMLTHWSTSALEFISRGIPTILVNPKSRFDFNARFLDNYPAIASNLDEMKEMINNFMDEKYSKFHEYRRSFVKINLFREDGKGVERSVNAIIDQLNASKI